MQQRLLLGFPTLLPYCYQKERRAPVKGISHVLDPRILLNESSPLAEKERESGEKLLDVCVCAVFGSFSVGVNKAPFAVGRRQ
jgi:hypothetical protein